MTRLRVVLSVCYLLAYLPAASCFTCQRSSPPCLFLCHILAISDSLFIFRMVYEGFLVSSYLSLLCTKVETNN